ncbi:hypothetical protein Tco_0563725 [Tanacetum coccineum]
MSAVANTTPIVTTVIKTANKKKTQKEKDKVNIQDFCEEHYDDILPIIMDKVRHDKRKEVHTRLDFAESSEKGLDRAGQALGILPVLEVAPPVQTAPDTEIASATLKSRTMVSTPPKGLGPSTEDPLETDVDPGARGNVGKENLHHPADLKAALVTRAIESQEIKGAKRWRKTWPYLGAVRMWIRLHLEFATSKARGRSECSIKWNTLYGTGDPEDHIKVFQASAQVERWAIPTWCHMFNSTLIGPARKKHVKDPVEIHNIKQKDGEMIEEFMERFKVETGRMNGAPECMKISGFMHGVNNPELTKRLNEHVPKTLEEMMTTTAAFIRGETAGWTGTKQVHPLNRTPKEIFAAESEKFKPPPPMVTPADKRSSNKFCEFHNDKGHSTDECMQLKKQIEELPWHRVTRQKVTLSFAHVNEITFPPLSANKGTEGPLVIEAEIGGHAVHRMYVDGGSSMKVLYEH